MKTLNFIKPKSDSVLNWNETTNQYELTPEFVKANFDVNYSDDATLEKRIKKNSRKIYNFIRYRAYSGNFTYIKILLNRTVEGREFLKNVLLEQLEADNETGFNDLSSQPAIDMASGRELSRDSLYENQISVDTEQLIEANSEYFGFNIMVRYSFPPMVKVYLGGAFK